MALALMELASSSRMEEVPDSRSRLIIRRHIFPGVDREGTHRGCSEIAAGPIRRINRQGVAAKRVDRGSDIGEIEIGEVDKIRSGKIAGNSGRGSYHIVDDGIVHQQGAVQQDAFQRKPYG